MAINQVSLIIVEGNQLLNAIIMASLAILQSDGVSKMPKTLGNKVRIMAPKAMVVAGYGQSSGHACS